MRRYALLEMPAWVLVGVSVAYAIFAGGGGFNAFFQFSLLVAAVGWLVAGRLENFTWASVLIGWALGTMALFNLLVWDFAGDPYGLTLAPVTIYLGVVIFLLEQRATRGQRLAAAGGVLASAALQLLALAIVSHP